MITRNKGFSSPVLMVALAASVFLQAGCSMDRPSEMNASKIRLEETQVNETVASGVLDTEALISIADAYRDYGDGPVEVIVTYDPMSAKNTALQATTHAERIATRLQVRNVPVEVDILPVHGQGDISETFISYNRITALPPEGCYAMGGVDGTLTQADDDYKIGCTIDMKISRQIASPKDLGGREGLDTADGRRLSNIVERYRTGEPLEPLEEISMSGGLSN